MLSREMRKKINFDFLGPRLSFISSDSWTTIGLGVSLLCAYSILLSDYFLSAFLLLFMGFVDVIDGAVARAEKKTSKFGVLYDASIDRVTEGIVLGALATKFPLAIPALIASFMVSYVRARAELIIKKCDVGFAERGERILILFLGLLLNMINEALLILTVLAGYTALRRLLYARNKTGNFD